MIDLTHLRVGNLFSDVDGTECYFAGAWEREDGWIVRDSANNTCKEKEIYPIELSEEWLLRFGFKNKKSSGTSYFDNYWLLDKYGISKCTFDNNGYRKGSFYCGNTEREIKHVHQLMNLYFALTGKELTIQPLKV